MQNFPSAGIPNCGYETRQYVIGFVNSDGSLTATRVEAVSLCAAEEMSVEYLNESVEIFAEECEKPEEPEMPVVI